jgi:signal transduction histidine kinase
MHHLISARGPARRREGLVLTCAAAVPVGIAAVLAPESAALAGAAVAAQVVAGAYFLLSALLLYLDRRLRKERWRAWLGAATGVLACHLLGSAALTLTTRAPRPAGWALLVDLVLTGIVAVLAWVGLRDRPPPRPDPLLTGLGLGALSLVLILVVPPLDIPLPWGSALPVAAMTATYGFLAVACVVKVRLPRRLVWRFAAVPVLLGLSRATVWAPTPVLWTEMVAAILLMGASVLYAATTFRLFRSSLEDQRLRAARLESSLLSAEDTDRAAREAMHELKATISGLTRASQLLVDADVPVEVRDRLEKSVCRELQRMERRLWVVSPASPEVVDLDAMLDALLELHRARGHGVAWAPSGLSASGCSDALTEAVSILLDNAARHGDARTGRITAEPDERDAGWVRITVSDDGPGVPAEVRDRMFDWGVRGPGSGGQGIGLHLARRLVVEQGGSLVLDESRPGASFVIRVPRAGTDEEVARHVRSDHHAV